MNFWTIAMRAGAATQAAVVIAMFLMPWPERLHAGEYLRVKQGESVLNLYRARADELSIHWKDNDGAAMRTLDSVLSHLNGEGKQVPSLINGGIFEPGGVPTGLHVEAGKTLRPLNLAVGQGNFFLKPNGVLFVEGTTAKVMESEAYAALNPAPAPRLALQSGPMLLIDGKTHPKFRARSKNRLHRNGVGILADGRLLFIMTHLTSGTWTNLFQFAALFRRYGCQNALFLDGDFEHDARR